MYQKRWDIHAIYIPEIDIDIESESKRLNHIMDEHDCVNIFLSEGAGIDNIIKDLKSSGKEIKKDAFGHVRLDEINPGQWYAKFLCNNDINAYYVQIYYCLFYYHLKISEFFVHLHSSNYICIQKATELYHIF